MKKILLFIFFFVHILSYAQLDREHWFGPMVDRLSSYNGAPNSDNQAIYMSTGESTPFKVEVYFNNSVIATYTLSKNNPQKHIITSADRKQIIATPGMSNPMNDLFQPVKMGFYLKGEKPFFASLRFSTFNHGEIVTSKGTAALGTEFRSVTAPLLGWTDFYNSMSSVMATENNTKVTISEFKPDIIFWDDIPRTEITFELNKGESYIVEVNDVWYENHTGYIGAKIVSDKPVIVTNGNFNGQYVSNNVGSDILMDQSVPVNKLGKNFVLVKGNGENSFVRFGNLFTMEKALIVASKNNTRIYLNGDPTPAATLNAGEFFTTPPNSYVDQGSDHYNMYIESTEDIYVYQLLAGQDGQISEATGGMNYIPPLSCYLPKKIDEIGLIDENLFFSNTNPSGRNSVPTKLNVITEKGAVIDVKRNGTSLPITAANGPHNVSGNNTWQTYSFPNITGNIAVFSTKAVTAGLSAGDDAVGYGGYFAGFSSTPQIIKTAGDCLSAGPVRLEVTAGFDSYEWYSQDDPTKILSTTFFYYPTSAGIYFVKIKTGFCAGIQTENLKFFNCTDYTNYNYSTCTVQKIIPKFALSTQAINPSSVAITVQPTKGTVSIALDGTLTYTAKPNESGIDTFRFSFCGVGALSDCEVIQVTIQINQVVHYDVILKECSTNNNANFNLKNAAVTTDLTAQKLYYKNSNLSGPITGSQIENYAGINGEIIYVYIKNSFGCDAISKITLETNTPPTVNENLYTKLHCDEDIDGKIDGNYKVTLNTITPVVIPTIAGLTIRYYDNETKANIGGNNNITGIFTFTNDRTPIWIWVKANNACPPVIKKIILRTGTQFTINNPVADFVCDNELDNSADINLANYTSLFTTDVPITVYYFDDFAKAQTNLSADRLNANQTITGNKTFYYRFKKTGLCENIGTLNLTLRQPRKSLVLVDKEICAENVTSLDAGPGFDSYLWSNGETSQETANNLPIGDYWVDLSSNGCVYRQNVSVKPVALPQIISVEIKGSTVTVNVSGGNPPYQYAIDGGNYQTSNIFTNVRGGDHTIYVISADNCFPVSAEINVIEIYNALTPNGDGINDVLNYSALLNKEDPFIQIYDRFGKTVFTGDKNNLYSWDGKASGKIVATGSYWYVMKWREPGLSTLTEYSGWILVKNRE